MPAKPPKRTITRRHFLASVALGVVGVARAKDASIYRTYETPGGTPIYSDHPLDKTSRIIAVFDGNQLWPRSGGGPVTMAQIAARRAALEPLLQRIASMHGIHAALLKAVIEVESGFNAQACSAKGAIGLMQVMPATAARYGQYDLYSPEQNVDVGAHYLHDLLAMFSGNVRLAVAAYNAGENAVIRSGWKTPAYPETLRYVPMVLERYNRYLSASTH